MTLSNRYGKNISNLKVLDLVPSLSSFKEIFISSYYGFIVVVGNAPSIGYVSDRVGKYKWFLWVQYGVWYVD